MGNGVSAAAQLPDTIDKEQARTLLGDNFDEAKFDSVATDGAVSKDVFLSTIEAAEAAVSTTNAAGAEGAGESAADATAVDGEGGGGGGGAAAAGEGDPAFAPDPEDVPQTDIEAFHSLVRWNKDIPQIQAKLQGTTGMVHARDVKNGNYALHIAAQNGHTELVKLLLAARADPNKQNLAGQTALHMTQTYEMTELSDMLLNAGADPELKNDEGHTAKSGLEGKQNRRYGELKALLEDPSEAGFVAFFEAVRASIVPLPHAPSALHVFHHAAARVRAVSPSA